MKEAVLNLNIHGMTSPACVSRIVRAFKKEPFIYDATLSLATEQARVVYDANKISSIDIYNIVLQAGFEVKGKARRSRYKLNLALAVVLTLPLAITLLLGIELNPWFQFLLSTPVQFICGRRFYKASWKSLKKAKLTFDLLVVIGASASYFLSLYILLSQQLLEQESYFESSSIIITIALIGSYLESKSRKHATETLRSLESLLPLDASSYKLDDVVYVRPGTRVPVDGIIIEGFSQTDESQITGETFPIFKGTGDQVIGGSKNGDGSLKVRVTSVGEETVLARTIKLIEETQVKRASLQRVFEKFSSLIVLLILITASLTLYFTYGETRSWEESFVRAVVLLVVASPCALMLTIPTGIILGERIAAENGVLIKDPKALETTQRTTFVAFDKTGILTEGKPSVTHLLGLSIPEEELIQIISSLQVDNAHPLAKATLELAQRKSVLFSKAESISLLTGQGIEGVVNGRSYSFIGQRLMDLPLPEEAKSFLYERQAEGESVSFLIDQSQKKLLGLVSFQDQLKDQSHFAINQLKSMGIKTALLTGDNQSSANKIAQSLGIDFVHSELFPEEKKELIDHYKKKNVLAMAGDGVDDAATLALADVGITFSTGTDVAIHNSGITLMRGNPLLISDAISISRSTYHKIKQNLFWAFSFNVLGISLAVPGELSPSMAGRAIVVSSFIVLINSLSLKRWKSGPRYR